MDLSQIEKKLSKINTLFDAVKADGSISAIERDLLLDYTRGFYESLLATNNAQTPTKAGAVAPKPVHQPVVEHITAPIATTRVEATPVLIVPPAPEPVAVVEPPRPIYTPEPDAIAEVRESTPVVAPVVQQYVATPQVESTIAISSAIKQLFVPSTGKELSERLAQSPITDLLKAMGLNDRLMMAIELFEGDDVLFGSTCSAINGLTSYDDAVKMLLPVAQSNKWDHEEREEKAQAFIRLVQRKFK